MPSPASASSCSSPFSAPATDDAFGAHTRNSRSPLSRGTAPRGRCHSYRCPAHVAPRLYRESDRPRQAAAFGLLDVDPVESRRLVEEARAILDDGLERVESLVPAAKNVCGCLEQRRRELGEAQAQLLLRREVTYPAAFV